MPDHVDAPPAPRFVVAEVAARRLRLRCTEAGTLSAPAIAWVGGIEAGRAERTGPFAAEEVLEVVIDRLPCAPAPALLRLGPEGGTGELAPPLELGAGNLAWRLMGPGNPELEALELRQGLLRGTLLNRENGFFAPVLAARVQGGPPRPVAAEPPQPGPDGAGRVRFALALRAEDLDETGMQVEIWCQGLARPVATWALAPAFPEQEAVPVLAARLRAAEQASVLREARLRQAMEQGFAERDARFDGFVQHVMGLLAEGGAPEPRIGPPEARLEALRATLATPLPEPAPQPAERVLPSDDDRFTLGWYPPESEFRWMGPSGLIENPEPARPVERVRLRLRHVYGDGPPQLLATLDAHGTTLTLEAVADGFVAQVEPGAAVAFEALRLDSLSHGSPLRDGHSDDARELSVAVGEVTFVYAA
ncbi:hypothetical protein LPC08_05125 [Roseomonas sp. OT10]|uniref:hypothetical protein n=1 Tax=Roseomonas cutis TaxID=2897332 RepID=UPI001E52B650|nr:hypothetical protein [Roseomonas sp. OT10]UFN50023.1 hypothetical protein LPC08_05125 [Roseomonas sp. OT10]